MPSLCTHPVRLLVFARIATLHTDFPRIMPRATASIAAESSLREVHCSSQSIGETLQACCYRLSTSGYVLRSASVQMYKPSCNVVEVIAQLLDCSYDILHLIRTLIPP